MKRIQYACVEKTIHFQLKDDLPHSAAVTAVRQEVGAYKASLERKGIRCKICSEQEQPDGSVLLGIKMQYNGHAVGPYPGSRPETKMRRAHRLPSEPRACRIVLFPFWRREA